MRSHAHIHDVASISVVTARLEATHIYDIRQLVNQEYTHIYDIRKLVNQEYTNIYDIRQLVNQVYTHIYDIRQTVNTEFIHIYDIRPPLFLAVNFGNFIGLNSMDLGDFVAI